MTKEIRALEDNKTWEFEHLGVNGSTRLNIMQMDPLKGTKLGS